MRKNLLSILLCIVAIFAMNSNSFAQSKLIHYWHFNNDSVPGATYTPNIAPIHADYSLIDTAKAKIVYMVNAGTSAAYSTYLDFYVPVATEYDTVNVRFNDTANNKAFKARDPADSMELRFYIPTTHYKNIKLKYAYQRTTSGATFQSYDYSLDSGATWKTSGLATAMDSATLAYFSLFTEVFTDTLVNNNSKLVFRVKFSGGTGIATTSGNNRFDNVTVEGDTLTAATDHTGITEVSIHPTFMLYPNPVTNVLNIATETEGIKMISIRNIAGEQVFVGALSGKQYPLDISNLQAGIYFISVNERGKTSSVQFIKQ